MDGGVSAHSSNHGIMPPKAEPSSSRLSPSLRLPKSKFDPNISNENAPPYWTRDHNRTDTVSSFDSLMGRGITMADNTTDTSETNAACWAKSATIEDYETVSGNSLNVGAFVVYNISIKTLSGSEIRLSKRYSEFDILRHNLLMTFPLSEQSMPQLPPKGVVAKFRPKFLEKRKAGLQYFLNCVLLNPEFSRSPVLKEFLFGR